MAADPARPEPVLRNRRGHNSEGPAYHITDKQMLRELMSTTPALQEMLKGVLKAETKGHETVTQSDTKK